MVSHLAKSKVGIDGFGVEKISSAPLWVSMFLKRVDTPRRDVNGLRVAQSQGVCFTKGKPLIFAWDILEGRSQVKTPSPSVVMCRVLNQVTGPSGD